MKKIIKIILNILKNKGNRRKIAKYGPGGENGKVGVCQVSMGAGPRIIYSLHRMYDWKWQVWKTKKKWA